MKKVLHLTFALACMLTVQNVSAQEFWIVGGDQAHEGQFPWIGDQRVFNSHQCGSSLIAPSWVITAAHCVIDFGTGLPQDTTGMRFRFNSINTNGLLNPSGGVEAEPAKIFIHQLFSTDVSEIFSKGYDIALVKLKHPVTGITPIPLPSLADTTTLYNTGQPVKIAGWGVSDTLTFATPDTLKYCNAKVYDFVACGGIYPGLTRKTFCAGFRSGEDPAGAAVGDSGGPVWVDNSGSKKITGIVSGGTNGFTGADLPAVYTKVATFRPWIDSIMLAEDGTNSIEGPEWSDKNIRIGTGNQSINIFFGAINASDISCNVYNAEGRKVYEKTIANPANSVQAIDMSACTSGLYIVRFHNAKEGKYFSKKIVKNF